MNTATSMNKDVRAVDLKQVNLMRLHILMQQGLTAIISNSLISVITAVTLYPIVSTGFVWTWVLLSLMLSSVRLVLLKQLRSKLKHDVSEQAIRFYENIYAAGLLMSGMVWGSLGWVFGSTTATTQQIIIPLVIGGMSAGAVFSHLSSIRSYYAFVIPMVLPVTVSIFLAGLPLEASTTLVYLVAVLLLTKNLNQRLVESLFLRHENSNLVQHLIDVNKSQSQLLQTLQAKEAFLLHTFQQAGVPMLLMDAQFGILDVNKAACDLLGYNKKMLTQLAVTDLLYPADSVGLSTQFQQLITGRVNQYTITRRCVNKAGRVLWLYATLSAVRNETDSVEYIVVQAQDMTQQHQLSQDLQHQSLHDALTGLPNRIALEKYLQQVLQDKSDAEHIFCFIDLDQFKVINDTCGHLAGDALLRQISQLLQQSLHKTDLLVRFSGDEFALLMVNCKPQQARKKLEKLLQQIRGFNFTYDSYNFNITASMGLVAVDKTSTMVELLKHGDSACFAAKEAGRDRIHVFKDDDSQLVQRSEQMSWVAKIQQALSQEKLVLFSQPIQRVAMGQKSAMHCELLIRMLADDGSVIAPGAFLPAAERYNLAAAIDMWTVKHAVNSLSAAHKQGRNVSGIYAINLSGQSLGDSRFYEKIIDLIVAAKLTEADVVLCFEITETAAITNIGAALHFIHELRNVGCLFALDDFGSGLSSFAYLKQLPIDYLKIDGIFVKDAVNNRINMEIVQSINSIGQALGLQTVAEFVEDEATLDAMQRLGVDFVQGYKVGKPKRWQI